MVKDLVPHLALWHMPPSLSVNAKRYIFIDYVYVCFANLWKNCLWLHKWYVQGRTQVIKWYWFPLVELAILTEIGPIFGVCNMDEYILSNYWAVIYNRGKWLYGPGLADNSIARIFLFLLLSSLAQGCLVSLLYCESPAAQAGDLCPWTE